MVVAFLVGDGGMVLFPRAVVVVSSFVDGAVAMVVVGES
jgi:hypothetical protein